MHAIIASTLKKDIVKFNSLFNGGLIFINEKKKAEKKAEKERAEKERAEKERAEKERAEKERAEKEKVEKERAEKAKILGSIVKSNHLVG
jgi:uncharacterized protein YaiL (DUF2058 family)